MNNIVFALVLCILIAAPLMECRAVDIAALKERFVSMFQNKLKNINSQDIKKLTSDLLSNDVVKKFLRE